MPDTFTLIKNRTEPRLGQLELALATDESARPAWVIAILASVLIFTTVVDVLGNLLVIISVFRNRKLRNSGNVFVVSLAFADLVVAFYPYPMVLYALFHDGWSVGNTQCMSAVQLSQHSAVCCLNLASHIVAIIPNFFVGSLRYDPRVYSCTFDQNVSSSYTVAVVVVHFLVPIAVVTFCYLRIWVLVIQVRRKVKSEESPRIRPSDVRNFITMFVVFVLFAICWAPLNLIGLAVAIDPSRVVPRIPEWLFVVSYFMAYFNSCLNAIIYGLLNRNFRNEYKRIVTSNWMVRLFVTETSRGATDGRSVRSKQSPPPPINNNESVRDRSNKE
ncbi:Melatonin receptor type 1B-B [Dissostichus eleginoides]|uniref:Melatonin receptor type 1B-B n=1 Tax=Dissostichus eleginoides TaxID=100907 RepID=A0AAD9EYU8_DISEL|nr:Melatonin receptor type 1B-B [Dissostichus eleginoides]